MFSRLFIIFLILFSKTLYCKEVEPPRTGNFALATSQQPNPLLGFGGNIVDKGNVQGLFLGADTFFKDGYEIYLQPGILYGITDKFSIFPNIPIEDFKHDGHHSSGLGDAFIELEYAFYTPKTKTYEDQYTIVLDFYFPTGSAKKNPPTGFGSISYQIGATYSRTYVDWFYFTSDGFLLTTSKNGTKLGNSVIYDIGIGRNICSYKSDKNGFIFAWMIEIGGSYSGKNRINGVIDPNSGGNITYFLPSLWYSTPKLVFQLGIGPILTQHLFGNQAKATYLIQTNIGWTFK